MKLNRLESTTQHPSSGPVERLRRNPDEVRRVEAAEGMADDRQRSLQQELATFDPRAIGPFDGGERVLQDAQAIAVALACLGEGADALIKPALAAKVLDKVDDKA